MENKDELSQFENLFLALADKTRLRILNLMRENEVCVNLFSEALMLSQPKISRHLAYLRNTGIVSTRRDGKWIYYSINYSTISSANQILSVTLARLASLHSMQRDHDNLILLSRPRSPKPSAASQKQIVSNEPHVYYQSDEIETFLL